MNIPSNADIQVKDAVAVFAIAIFLCSAGVLFDFFSVSTFYFLVLGWTLQSIMLFWVFRKLQHQAYGYYCDSKENGYRKIEALMSVFASISPTRPLPSMSGYSASPLLASALISEIETKKPKVILELGSGVSTLISAYCLSKNGSGIVFSLDHEREYADLTKSLIKEHGLEDFVDVIYSPLMLSAVNEEKWKWYSLEQFVGRIGTQKIDIVVVDGPPHDTQSLARYPALPLLLPYLSDNAVIIMDDASRSDEKNILGRWLQEFSGQFVVKYIEGDRGTALMQRQSEKVSLGECTLSLIS